jgi:hypothetical protein
MNCFLQNVELYKSFDPERVKSVEAISSHLKWSNHVSYVYKYFLSELSHEELGILDTASEIIDVEIVAAVCIQNRRYRLSLIKNIDRINAANSPFNEIEVLVAELDGVDPLSKIRNEFWLEVGNYLTEREINKFPFSLKSIGFIKLIGYKGYNALTKPQKKYIVDLIQADKERIKEDRFFTNEHLTFKGFKNECQIIENYIPCP